MLAASARTVAVQYVADGTPTQALSVITQVARRVTMARRAAVVLTDPTVRQPSVVAVVDDAPDAPHEPVSAEQLLWIDQPDVRMVEMITGNTTIGLLVLNGLSSWGMLASDTTGAVLDLADLAATAVIFDRVYRFCGDTAGRIEGDVIDDVDPLRDLWWVVLTVERWRRRPCMSRDAYALSRLCDRVDQLVRATHRVKRRRGCTGELLTSGGSARPRVKQRTYHPTATFSAHCRSDSAT